MNYYAFQRKMCFCAIQNLPHISIQILALDSAGIVAAVLLLLLLLSSSSSSPICQIRQSIAVCYCCKWYIGVGNHVINYSLSSHTHFSFSTKWIANTIHNLNMRNETTTKINKYIWKKRSNNHTILYTVFSCSLCYTWTFIYM